jgi:hypothetical protein
MQSFFDVIALMLKRAPWVQGLPNTARLISMLSSEILFKEVEAGLNPEGERIVP